MPDTITRLNAALEGRYRIERGLGEGGMATVYLARDLKHNRNVALKVLKPELAAVVGAERFLAEIQTTANLQHPHILPLYDSGEADTFLYYVMPYVEGETLRQRLDAEKQLTVDEAVHIARAVASALDFAHRRGVVHRDIKPGNILFQAGEPVVGDFGIALAVGAGGGTRLTETGLSLGTPYYMSPEQATGDQQVGARSDIYSLGCVLYEMLVGDPPYLGSTAQAVLGQIITGQPVAATEKRASVPEHVDAVVRKALEKVAADRFATAGDLAAALDNQTFRHGPEPVGVVAASAKTWNRLSVATTAVAGLLALALVWTTTRSDDPPPVERYALSVPQSWLETFNLALSNDGSTIVFLGLNDEGDPQLHFRRLDELTLRRIPGTVGGCGPVLSPDGAEVAFLQGGELKVTRLEGGLVRTLTDEATCCLQWYRDGFIYFSVQTDGRIARIPEAGGTLEWVTDQSDDEEAQVEFRLLPGADVGVYTVTSEVPRIEAVRLDTRERLFVAVGQQAVPLSDEILLFLTEEGQAMAARLDPGTLEIGAAIPVVDSISVAANGVARFTLSESGTLLYWAGQAVSDELELVWVTRDGAVTQVHRGWTFDPSSASGNRSWDLSPDGGRIAMKILTDQGPDIWIKELPEGPTSRFTFYEGEDRFPKWTPDGEHLSFISDRGGNLDVWMKRADGVGEPELLVDHQVALAEGVWSPDGEWLIVRTNGAAGVIGGRDMLALRPGVDSVAEPLISTEFDEASPTVSRDGRWLAYQSNETGTREVFIRPFPEAGGRKIQVSDGGGRSPVWAHSGDELYYVTEGGGTTGARDLMVARIRPGPPLAVTETRVLMSVPQGFYFAQNTTSYDVTADDQRFLMARDPRLAEGSGRGELILVRNFAEEVKRRLGN